MFIFSIGASTVEGQNFSPVAEWAEDASLHDVFFVDPVHGWAVGSRGTILSTDDGGRRWRPVRSPVTCELDSVFFLNHQIGWIVGGFARPMTATTSGVVLRTEDGGASWKRVSGDRIPWLKRIHMDDTHHGWALAHRSAAFPSGLAVTRDGGQSWHPIGGLAEAEWTDAARVGVGQFVMVGRLRQGGRIEGADLEPGFVVYRGAGDLAALAMADARHGWSCDDRGNLLFTSDGGFSWDVTDRHPDAQQTRGYAWNTVAIWGDHVWLAGSPGDIIWHSADAGQRWTAVPTGTQMPIQRLHFRDELRGWAVGANGLVLATEDGGKSWYVQRQATPRVALLGVFSEYSQVPLEFFARYSGNDGYSAALLVMRSQNSGQHPDSPASDRLRLAGGGVGLAGIEELVRDAEESDESFKERLVRKIRTWRPSVVITDLSSDRSDADGNPICTQQQLVEALHQAARFDDAQTQGRRQLAPWQVEKTFAVVDSSHQADWSVPNDQFAARLGTSLDDYCLIYRRIVSVDEPLLPPLPRSTHWQLIDTSLVGQSKQNLFAGLDPNSLIQLRRTLAPPAPGNLDVMRKQARKWTDIERIAVTVDSTSDDSAIWSRQVEGLLIGLGELGAGNALFQLAEEHQRRRQLEASARALHWLVLRYRAHPFWDQAMMWLIRYYASAEARWLVDKENLRLHIPLAGNRVEPASADVPDDDFTPRIPTLIDDPIHLNYESPVSGEEQSVDNVSPGERFAHAQLLLQALDRRRPAVPSDNALQFALAAMRRTQNGTQWAPPQLIDRAEASGARWQQIAACERWLRDSNDAPPVPVMLCYMSSQPPLLDGQLQDAIWASTSAVPMALFGDMSTEAGEVRLAYDREFLFVAIRCPWESDPARKVAREAAKQLTPRLRDADLAEQDRVSIELDIDRDWATSFRFEVDHRGWTRDSALGNQQWDPQWFVAHQIDDDYWTVEIAIPFSQLGVKTPMPNEAWAVRVERHASTDTPASLDRGIFKFDRANALLMYAE